MPGEFRHIGSLIRSAQAEEIHQRLLRSKTFRSAQRGKMLLYEYLRSRIVRDGGGGESRIVHENYYRAGRLAASSSLRELADDFGYSSTAAIRSFLDQLHRDGFIQIEAINVGKTRAQNVFIMGTHDEAGEHYFIEGVYLKQA